MKEQLLEKIRARRAVIGIVGLGYVGLPLMLRFSEVGFRVLGFDIDRGKVDALNQGRSYIEHITAASIKDARQKGFRATADFSESSKADALIICTEWKAFRAPDFEVMKTILKSPVIFDGRNLYEPNKLKKLGFTYYAIGRGDSLRTAQ